MIEVYIENSRERILVPQGVSLAELSENYKHLTHFPILGALVNNEISDLGYRLYKPKRIMFFDISNRHGYRMYINSVAFLLYKAVHDLFPQGKLYIEHSLLNGLFCRIADVDGEDNVSLAYKVREYMNALVYKDLPFTSQNMMMEDALKVMAETGNDESYRLMQNSNRLYAPIVFLADTPHMIYSKLVPSTGLLKVWDFSVFSDGFLLQMPSADQPMILSSYHDTPRLFKIFREHREWKNLLQTLYVCDLNDKVRAGKANFLIQVAEALHEKKYSLIADAVYQKREQLKMVLIAGPSSSGKTTSCRRLGVHLALMGFDVQQMSLDDYFVDRENTPRTSDGEYDFEAIEALDIPKLNEDLLALSEGKAVEIPRFDFITGKRFYNGDVLQMKENSILIIEGIHALNPKLTEQIPEQWKYRVYVSAMTQIAIDDQNIIRSSDNRLIRRMVRDYKFRGYSALETMKRWPSVRAGEQKHIFPYQENADVMFNSALMYELGILKNYAEPLLEAVPENTPEHAEACRLLKILSLFETIPEKYIPPTSIMREFLGESSFDY